MKVIIEKLASRAKKTKFKFDDSIDSAAVRELILDRILQICRSFLLVLRGKWPKALFLGKSVKFRSINKVDIGRWVSIGDYCFISGLGVGRLSISDGVSIGSHCRVFISNNYRDLGAYIDIGNNVGIGDYSCIAGSGGLSIGKGTITGPYFSVHPENHKFSDISQEIRTQGTQRGKIEIGSNCWIGAKVTILSGVTIGNGCVIGAGSVVIRDLPENTVAVGVPARVVKERK